MNVRKAHSLELEHDARRHIAKRALQREPNSQPRSAQQRNQAGGFDAKAAEPGNHHTGDDRDAYNFAAQWVKDCVIRVGLTPGSVS